MIRTIIPIVSNDMSGIVPWLIVPIISAVSAFIVSRSLAERLKGNKRKTEVSFLLMAIIMSILLICFFGFTAIALKGMILSLIFMSASYQDIKTHECDDSIHPMILITGLIGLDCRDLTDMIISAAFVFLIMMLTLHITKSNIGGADIKFSVACAFVLGMRNGMLGLIIGLAVAVIINLIKLGKNKKEGFPMIPYLAAGFTVAYFF